MVFFFFAFHVAVFTKALLLEGYDTGNANMNNSRSIYPLNNSFLLKLAVVVPLALSPLRAATLADDEFPDEAMVGDAAVVLNGLGLRTATMLKVKVYVIALYLENKSSDAQAIIESGEAKRIALHFVHAVTAKELRGGWTEGFEDNAADTAAIEDEIAQFNASMRDVEKGGSIVLDFAGDTVAVLINDERIDTVTGQAFQQAALSIWLGRKPPNDALKDGILGR
jgi:hypothetical protein